MLLDERNTERRDDIHMVVFKNKGEWEQTYKFLGHASKWKKYKIFKKLEKYGEKGVEALSAATPRDTGKTSESWGYLIEETGDGITLTWTNSNFNNYVNIAVILQYGHGTGTGGYVTGIDYINPALAPIFDKIADELWKEVMAS